VFAPTDAAFLALPPGVLTTLLKPENVDLLWEILTFHVVEGVFNSTNLSDGQELDTLNKDATLIIGVDNTTATATVTVNNVTVSLPTVLADNGVIHEIDQVLLPPGLVLPPYIDEIITSVDYPTLVAALQVAGFDDALTGPGPFTIFAPTEEAFANLPTGAMAFLSRNPDVVGYVLSYHAVDGSFSSTDLEDMPLLSTFLPGASLMVSIQGKNVMINDATVVGPDNVALNGVVHAIDTVLIPEGMIPPTIAGLVVARDGEFATLLAALQAGELVDALSGPGPFTVFAPSEAAFAKLPTGTIEFLLLPENKDLLVKILQQHVVSGDVKADDITAGMETPALNGETLTFAKTEDAGITVNGVSVVGADNLALNGVVHVVDEVLIPDDVKFPMSTILEVVDGLQLLLGYFTTLPSFLTAAGLIEDLSGPGPFSKYSR
jgi:transforming growth factor-beta-induced protein